MVVSECRLVVQLNRKEMDERKNAGIHAAEEEKGMRRDKGLGINLPMLLTHTSSGV